MTIGKVKEDLEEGVVALEGGHHQEVEDEEVSEVVGEDLVALDEVITKKESQHGSTTYLTN